MRKIRAEGSGYWTGEGSRARYLWSSFLRIGSACAFIAFVSFALAFGILGGHGTKTPAAEDSSSSASTRTEAGNTSPDGVTSASPGATQPGSPDLLASASPGTTGSGIAGPDLVTSPSNAASGGAPRGTTTTPDLVTSPSTAPAPAPAPGTPPDTVTTPSPGTTPAPVTETAPRVELPEIDDDAVIPLALAYDVPLLLGGVGMALFARRKRK